MFLSRKFLYAAIVFLTAIFTSASTFADGHLTVRISDAKYKEYLKGETVALEVYCIRDITHTYSFKDNSIDLKRMNKQTEANGSVFYVHTFQPEAVNDNVFCHKNDENYNFKVGVKDYRGHRLFSPPKMLEVFSDVEAAEDVGQWSYQITDDKSNPISKILANSKVKSTGLRTETAADGKTAYYYDVVCDETKTSKPPALFWQHVPGFWTNNGGADLYFFGKGYPVATKYLDAFVGSAYCDGTKTALPAAV